MSEPTVADNKPVKKSLTRGETYFFCACGRSGDQPFCDGSHKGTRITLMQVMARACGHDALSKLNNDDLATWKRDMADLSGVRYSGFNTHR